MKIAVSTEENSMDSPVDSRFGRAKGFIIYDDEADSFEFFENNQNLSSVQGAGIQSAKNIINSKAEVLITGNVGPKAFTALNTAGIEVYIGASGQIARAIRDYKNGRLQRAEGANVEGHW